MEGRWTLNARDRKRLAGLGIVLAVLLLSVALAAVGGLQRLEWITYDHRMRLHRADVPLHPDVAVVLIDEASLRAMNPVVGRYPWPRSVYADAIEFFALGGARAVVFDVLFSEQEPDSFSDARFAEATAMAGNVYHAAQLYHDPGIQSPRPLPPAFAERFGRPDASSLPALNNEYVLPIPPLYEAALGVGSVSLDADADGVFRRVPLYQRYGDRLYPALSTAPLLAPDDGALRWSGDRVHATGGAVPTADKRFLVNLAGRVDAYSIGGVFASIDAIRAGRFDQLVVSPEEFAGKIVFVGASAAGLEDLKATPLSSKTPGVFIHASATATLLAGDWLRYAPAWLEPGAVLLLAAVTVAAVLGFAGLLWQVLLPLLLLSGYLAIAYGRFADGVVMAVAGPTVATLTAYLGAFSYRAATEGRDRRRVRRMLGQYVSPAVLVEALDNADDQLRAGVGSRERLTILFSDVRGFTTISEQLKAEQVVELLNLHFSCMTEIIFRHQGTLDKFIGDAIMAFWGAPIRLADHPEKAVRAAIEMERGVEEVNAALRERGYPEIGVGLGLNTGDVVLGNIGSERKLDYTVIGDPVNLASRLEGLCKTYGVPVVISEFTRSGIGVDFPCATLDLVRVKGKQHPIRIFWPMALPEDPAEALQQAQAVAELSAEAFEHYLAREFDAAESLYGRLPEGTLRELFLARIADFRRAPPPAEWDGVFVMTSK